MAQWNRASRGYLPGMDLSSEQLDKVYDLRMQFQKDTISLRTKLQTRYLEIRNLLYKGTSRDLVDAAENEIDILQEELEAIYRDHQDAVKAILTEEQRELFGRWGGLGFGVSNSTGYGYAAGYGRGFGRGGGAGLGMGRGYGAGRGWGMNRGIGFNRGMGFNSGVGFNRGWRCPGLRNW